MNAMEQGIVDFIAAAEAEAKKLVPEVEAILEDIISIFIKVAPMLQSIDAIIAPTLKSSKATAANAAALTILGQVSAVAQAVNNVTQAAPTPPAQ